MATQSTWSQRLARTQEIMSAAWEILKDDKQLLLLPLASSCCLVVLTAVVAVPAVIGLFTGASVVEDLRQIEGGSYIGMFLFGVTSYAIGIFFNAALALCVLRKLEGKGGSVRDGLREAAGCMPQILGWAVVATTVGLLFKMIERRSGFIGGLIVKVVGMAWTVATFLVVPILVAEKRGPVDAVQESVRLLRKTWGEDLFAGIGFGALAFLLSIPGWLVFVIGAGLLTSHLYAAVIVMGLAILYFPILGLVLSTLSAIFDVVLYRFAKLGAIAPGFDRNLLASSFESKSS